MALYIDSRVHHRCLRINRVPHYTLLNARPPIGLKKFVAHSTYLITRTLHLRGSSKSWLPVKTIAFSDENWQFTIPTCTRYTRQHTRPINRLFNAFRKKNQNTPYVFVYVLPTRRRFKDQERRVMNKLAHGHRTYARDHCFANRSKFDSKILNHNRSVDCQTLKDFSFSFLSCANSLWIWSMCTYDVTRNMQNNNNYLSQIKLY